MSVKLVVGYVAIASHHSYMARRLCDPLFMKCLWLSVVSLRYVWLSHGGTITIVAWVRRVLFIYIPRLPTSTSTSWQWYGTGRPIIELELLFTH